MDDGRELGKCFVTGGAGFIGSHVSERLLAMGGSVTVYDNLSLGKRESIDHLFGDPCFRFIEADLRDIDALKEAMDGHDLVFHLGANTDIPRGSQDTRLDLENDIIATYNVLEVMSRLGVRKLLFASRQVQIEEEV